MPVYRTEIVIPRDRYVCLQLPDHLPEGRARVTVEFVPSTPAPRDDDEGPADLELDRQDIEWWEEFDGGAGASG